MQKSAFEKCFDGLDHAPKASTKTDFEDEYYADPNEPAVLQDSVFSWDDACGREYFRNLGREYPDHDEQNQIMEDLKRDVCFLVFQFHDRMVMIAFSHASEKFIAFFTSFMTDFCIIVLCCHGFTENDCSFA